MRAQAQFRGGPKHVAVWLGDGVDQAVGCGGRDGHDLMASLGSG
jgi:hypothetical protein